MSTSRQRRSTSGSAVIRRSSPASSIRAPDGNSAIRTSPLGRLRSPSTAACARASAVNTSSAWATSACPAGGEAQSAAGRFGQRHPDLRGQRPQLLRDRRRRERQRGGHGRHRPAVRQLAEHPQPCHVHEATLQRH